MPISFNEAAAYHCGKRARQMRLRHERRVASMRPQHITAENLGVGGRRAGAGVGFNEAAAYHCGKPRHGCRPERRSAALQ